MIILALVINILCNMGLTILAWFLVFIPIIMMTIISSLLLRIFGTNPEPDLMKEKVTHSIPEPTVERIDRDKIRKNLYDDIYGYYDFSYDQDNKYDMSKNTLKYHVVDNLVNDYGNNYFINSLMNSNLGNYFITMSNNITNLFSGRFSNNNSSFNTNSNNNSFSVNRSDNNNNYSYEDRYDDAQRYFEYYDAKHDEIKEELLEDDPNIEATDIDKEIERRWQNLSEEEKDLYLPDLPEDYDKAYDPGDLSRYRSRIIELENNIKENTQSIIDNTCPPGKEKNSIGLCVLPCPSVKENGDWVEKERKTTDTFAECLDI
tara:strand:- start:47 stop:997 length:951 start_codon:yes stop_codon:yes gene_type:complete